jgi:hypothetical protein
VNATFADFEDRLLPNLPGATRSAAKQSFYDAARTFYRRTRTWRTMIGALTIREGESTIALNPVDQNSEICFVEAYRAVTESGTQVANSGANGLANISFGGQSYRLSVLNPHTVAIYPPPRQTFERALWIEVSVQPSTIADMLPPEALTHHADALEAGCLARMFQQPAKPYTNAGQALFMGRRFEAEIARATGNQRNNYAQRATPWVFPVVSRR